MSVTDGTILRVVASMIWDDGNIQQNVFNAVVTGGGSPWADEDIVDDALAWVTTLYANFTAAISDELNGSQVQVYKYDAIDDDWDEVGSVAWPWTPIGAVDQLPRGTAGLINLRTSDPDVNGKKYIGGWTEGSNTDGKIPAADLALLALFATDWLTPFVGGVSGATWGPGIWSVVGTVFKLAVAHFIIPAIWAYQRRRKRGIGI